MSERILVDVDGVLADFSQHVITRLRLGAKLKRDDIDRWDIFGLIEEKFSIHHKKLALELMEDITFWRRLPLMPGAKEGVAALIEGGYEVVFVTSPWDSCVGWNVARWQWLEEHFDCKPHQLVITHAKYLVHGYTLIDDKVSHVEEWNERHVDKAMLFKAPYNNNDAHLRWDWPMIVRNLTGPDETDYDGWGYSE